MKKPVRNKRKRQNIRMFTMGLLCGLVLMGLVAWAFTAWRSASALAQAQPQQSAEIGHSAPPEAVVSPEQEAGPSGGPVVSGQPDAQAEGSA